MEKPTLRLLIENELRSKKRMTLDRAFKIANDNGYKQSTVERMLRPSNSPYVITTKNKKGYNTGYIYTVETTFKPYATNSKEPTGKTSKG